MLVQIQKYNLGDYEDRQLIEQSVDFTNESQVTEWVNSVLKNQPIETGYGYAPVNDSHPWYMKPTKVETVVNTVEPLPSRFEDVARIELEISRKARLARYQAELEQ